MRTPAISPDGTRLAASKVDGGNSELTVWDLATGREDIQSGGATRPWLRSGVVFRELPPGAGKLSGPEERKATHRVLSEGCQVGAICLARIG